MFAYWRKRQNAKVRLLARPDGGSVTLTRLAATLRPGTAGGVSVEYRVGEPTAEGIPLLMRSSEEEWRDVAIFQTEGRAAKALCDLVLPPPSFSFNWRAVAATAVVVAAALILTPAPSPPETSSSQASSASARQLSLIAPAVASDVAMPRPSIHAPPLAQPGDEGIELTLEEFMACDP